MGQQEPTNPEDQKWTYLLESDPAAAAKAIRRWQTVLFAGFAFVVTVVCWRIWRIDPPGGARPSPLLVIAAWIAGILLSLLAFCVRGRKKENHALIGADFIAARDAALGSGLAIVQFKDIVAVNLGLSKGRIVELGVRAKRLAGLNIRQVKDPAIAVRAIFDHAPQQVKWRRLRFPFTRLTRDEVAALIARADLPPADTMLPPGHALGRKDDVFPPPDTRGKNWHARLFAKGSGGGFRALRHEEPTPVTRYVSFMLLQMFDTGRTSHTLKRSEPLPTLTHRDATADPVPLDDVLARLKTLCGLDLEPTAGPVEATLEVGIEKTSCRFRLRFDDTADTCCEIRRDDQTH